MTIDELKNLDTSKFTRAAESWSAVSNRSSAARGRVDHDMLATLDATQHGFGADAARSRLGRLSKNYEYIHAECGMVRTVLTGVAEELAGPQRKLKQALEDAAALKFTVKLDGSVEYPKSPSTPAPLVPSPAAPGAMPSLLKPESTPDPNQAKAQEIANRIGEALKEAAEIDARYARVLAKLTADPDLNKTDGSDVARDFRDLRAAAGKHFSDSAIPKNKSPKENAAWWKRLSQAERDEYMALYPDRIGALDGVPAAVRDNANRGYLPILMGRLEEQDDDKSRTQLEGLKVIDEKLKSGSRPPMFLLGVSDSGNGRAIVSYGDPDAAKNVSVYVPGLGTKLDKDFADGGLERAQQTALEAQKFDRSSASVVWLGYDAPLMGVDQGLDNLDVADKVKAKRGAVDYDHFLEAVHVTNQNKDPHVTAIGHSYGSLTVGMSSQRPGGVPADDVILLGSPGAGVKKAADLGVGADHVFVGAAENDPVSKLPSKTDAAASLAGELIFGPVGGVAAHEVAGLLGEDDENWFGTDPASEAFGARRFKVADGPLPLVEKGFMPAHSGYFDPERDPESARNIGLIVSGHSNQITPEKRR
ncbi:alpha/beta hydrolase [Streptomyces sp. NPDC049585]|uniref:alpha/beta hydrolase n=1 Tax=Streptomyces sp. NPDC049585 TaxID=3155154 RepID=UPI003436B3EC